jgi:hypothetical protein
MKYGKDWKHAEDFLKSKTFWWIPFKVEELFWWWLGRTFYTKVILKEDFQISLDLCLVERSWRTGFGGRSAAFRGRTSTQVHP